MRIESRFLADLLKSLEENIIGLDTDGHPDEVSQETINKATVAFLEKLEATAPRRLRKERKDRKQFERHVQKIWGRAFDLLETFRVLALEIGADFNEQHRPTASRDRDSVFEVLTRLHARACQVSSEVLVLLKSGYATGAHARWRTLHEIAVVAQFVCENGPDVAERYLDHAAITYRKAMRSYQKNCKTLGLEPISEVVLEEIEAARNAAIERHGPDFKYDYGWAAKALSNTRPTFADIENAVSLERLRYVFTEANIAVHAGSLAVQLNPGLHPSKEDLILAGPSSYGLADPTHDTATSLYQITVAMLRLRPTPKYSVVLEAMERLIQMINFELHAAHAVEDSTYARPDD